MDKVSFQSPRLLVYSFSNYTFSTCNSWMFYTICVREKTELILLALNTSYLSDNVSYIQIKSILRGLRSTTSRAAWNWSGTLIFEVSLALKIEVSPLAKFWRPYSPEAISAIVSRATSHHIFWFSCSLSRLKRLNSYSRLKSEDCHSRSVCTLQALPLTTWPCSSPTVVKLEIDSHQGNNRESGGGGVSVIVNESWLTAPDATPRTGTTTTTSSMSSAPGSGDGPGGIPISTKTKRFKVKHPKRKLYRASEPLLSVFMWGVNYSVRELDHVSLPVMWVLRKPRKPCYFLGIVVKDRIMDLKDPSPLQFFDWIRDLKLDLKHIWKEWKKDRLNCVSIRSTHHAHVTAVCGKNWPLS